MVDPARSALGIDVGSTTVKIVALNRNGEIVHSRIEPTEPLIEDQIEALLARDNPEGADSRTLQLVATGYGRKLVKHANALNTEIKCHARGIFHHFGQTCTLIDIGGQDSKVVTIGSEGNILNFAMNDKCAAGSGRFLENTARRLCIPIEEIGDMALSTEAESPISSTCIVFAESEIISLIACGAPLEQIVRGLHSALIQRIASLARSIGIVPPIILSGGVARNPAIKILLEKKLREEVLLPDEPQLMGAYGAGLAALEE